MRRSFPPALLAVLFAVSGCKRQEEVRVYQAPKDRTSQATPSASPSSSGAAPESAANRPPWVVPEGWTEKPSSGGMRIATYAVSTPDGRSIDISVVPLGAQAGSTLDNVNRWRDQVGLPPVTESELPAQQQAVKIGTMDGQLYDIVSEKPMLDGRYKVRTLAAILSLPGTTVFFKATGEDALVKENLPKFKAWLASVQTGAPSGSAAGPSTGSSGASAGMQGPVSPPPSTAIPSWNVPAHWKVAQASTMRLASFAIPGGNGQTGDLSVVALGPAAGGVLANVNRWREQFGLSPLQESGLSAATTTVDLPGGDRATVVELQGEGDSAGRGMLAAIVPRADRTWFFKLTADSSLITAERENFMGFLKSVKHP